ncbi:hypothetical protein ABTN43_19415, partial [Acinetobacter baumannii]
MRAVDKLDKFSPVEVSKLLGAGRWDGGEEGKGDFTKGANLTPTQIEFVLGAVGQPSSGDNFAGLNELQSRFETT